MALSYVSYPISGTDYVVPFSYLNKSHVYVYRDGSLLATPTDYTWLNATTVRLVSATGTTLLIKRKSSWTSRLVDFSDGSVISEADLDTSSTQAFYMSQEAIDDVEILSEELDTVVGGAGNVPGPGVSDVGKFLKATATSVFGWVSLQWSDISGLIQSNIASVATYLNLQTGAYTVVGTAATKDVGTSALNVVQLDSNAKLPAVDGSNLTNLPSAPAAPSMPSGSVVSYAGSSSPSGWVMCYGQAILRSAYPNLFTAIGTTYGAGDGSTTFNVPDLRGRVVAGVDNMGGAAANRITASGSGITGTTLGASGGAETHTLTTAQMPSHTHTVPTDFNGTGSGATISGQGVGAESTTTSSSAGSGNAHQNTQPTMMLNFIIKE